MARQKRATNADKNKFIEIASAKIGAIVTRTEVTELCDSEDLPIPTWLMGGKYSAGRAKYRLPGLFGEAASASVDAAVVEDAAETITSDDEDVIENVAAVVPIKSLASSTIKMPFEMSRINTKAATFLPPVRKTLDIPVFPLP